MWPDLRAGLLDRCAVEGDASFGNQLLGIAPRADSGPRNELGNALAFGSFFGQLRGSVAMGSCRPVQRVAQGRR